MLPDLGLPAAPVTGAMGVVLRPLPLGIKARSCGAGGKMANTFDPGEGSMDAVPVNRLKAGSTA